MKTGKLFIDWARSGACIDMYCKECGYSNTHYCSFEGLQAAECPVCESVYLMPTFSVLQQKPSYEEYESLLHAGVPGALTGADQYLRGIFLDSIPVTDNGTRANFQWKGGGIYAQFDCECGMVSSMEDQWFVYTYVCPGCKTKFEMPRELTRFEGTKQELLDGYGIGAHDFDIDDEGNFWCDPDEQPEYFEARNAYRATKGLQPLPDEFAQVGQTIVVKSDGSWSSEENEFRLEPEPVAYMWVKPASMGNIPSVEITKVRWNR